MSYAFRMYFKEVKDKAEAFDVALNVTNNCLKSADEYIRKVLETTPYIEADTKDKKKNLLNSLFTFQFTYWKSNGENLLGMICAFGESVLPDSVTSLFDTYVDFQNQTDQNYSWDSWSDKISIFYCLKKVFMTAEAEFIASELEKKEQDVAEDLEYYRKMAMYDIVFRTLHLIEWLCDEDDESFTRFAMSSLSSMEKELDAWKTLQRVMNK